jgi:hypothetical protein
MNKHSLVIALAGAACLVLGTQAAAGIDSVRGPVPSTAENPMLGPADFPGAKLGISLKPFGYVEEEYFLTGTAAAYGHGAGGPVARTGKLPYTTRIVIRRPADPAKFSGVVHYEPVHPTQGYNGHWLVLDRYLMSRGDIYVFAGVGDASKGWSGSPKFPPESGPIGINRILQWFNPQRYAAISWPEEEGIRYEVMGDIGRKLRSNDADNPLRGLAVRAMLVGGWSYTGSIQRTYINEGFHELIRLPDGRPVFDGYLVGVSSAHNDPGYLPLYNDESFVALTDPRRVLRKTDARVIEFLTESEAELGNAPTSANVPDSDAKVGGHRVYELAGVIHVDSLHDPDHGSRERPYAAQLIDKGYKLVGVSAVSVTSCALPQSDVPQGAFVRAAVDNLRRWVLDGTPPPRAQPLERSAGKLLRDSAGNIRGGIRAAEFEVPLAKYGRYEGSAYPACRAEQVYPNSFFVRDPLPQAELRRRYGTPAGYLRRYSAVTDRLVATRWLLPEDALRLKAAATERVAGGF